MCLSSCQLPTLPYFKDADSKVLVFYCPIKALTSQINSLSSQPQLAHHPSAPNKHQSTPITNSVCAPIRPISLPPPNANGSPPPKSLFIPIPIDGVPSAFPPAPSADPSVQTRQVISYDADSRTLGRCGDHVTWRTA